MNHANHQQQQHQEPAQNSGSAMGGKEREQAFNLIYRHEHVDDFTNAAFDAARSKGA